ncbi:MAG: dihydrolipoamide acetyltransferase family protein [Gaiella sp.]
MANAVKIPRLGQGMESGTIVRWLKNVGEPVHKREPLYELDTDKVTQEVEAEEDGVLLEILVESGEAGVGTTVAWVGTAGEAVPSGGEAAPSGGEAAPSGGEAAPTGAAGDGTPAPSAPQPAEPSAARPAVSASTQGEHAKIKASPLARRIARERGIDLGAVAGSGPDGRIVARDVEVAQVAVTATAPETATPPSAPAPAPVAPAPGEAEVVALTSIRRTIARRLTEAWTAPVFQLSVTADARQLVATREAFVAQLREGEAKPSVNDVLVKLAAVALLRHPELNATYAEDAITRFGSAHVGIAVAAPAGLVVPVIRYAERLTVREIAEVRADLVSRARDGKLTLDEMQGGTFTISNLGMFEIDRFTAVINPPQAAILAAGSVAKRPFVVDDQLAAVETLELTLTCDHRAIDGADGAGFLRTLRSFVELPSLAL